MEGNFEKHWCFLGRKICVPLGMENTFEGGEGDMPWGMENIFRGKEGDMH